MNATAAEPVRRALRGRIVWFTDDPHDTRSASHEQLPLLRIVRNQHRRMHDVPASG